MNATFLNQWQLSRRGGEHPSVVGLVSRTESAFDPDVTVGEIRIFADTNRSLVALVLDDRRLSGWRIVPVSPFAAPASSRECAVGEHVLQLWNATVASRRFVARSWRVDTIESGLLEEIRSALPGANPGRLTAGDGVQAKYEHEYLISSGDLVPFAEPAAEEERTPWMPTAFKFAASLAVCLGAWYVLTFDAPKRAVRDWRDSFRATRVCADAETIELCSVEEPAEALAESKGPEIEIEPPQGSWPGETAVPAVAKLPDYRCLRAPRLPEELARKEKGGPFASPADKPMAVVFGSSGRTAGARSAPSEGYAVAPAPLAVAPKVSCAVEKCPWNLDHYVLAFAGDDMDGVKVTVDFDAASVEGYRRIPGASDGLSDALFEIVPVAGKKLGARSVLVNVLWPASDGDRREPVTPVWR